MARESTKRSLTMQAKSHAVAGVETFVSYWPGSVLPVPIIGRSCYICRIEHHQEVITLAVSAFLCSDIPWIRCKI
jgi:hypothetical protein